MPDSFLNQPRLGFKSRQGETRKNYNLWMTDAPEILMLPSVGSP